MGSQSSLSAYTDQRSRLYAFCSPSTQLTRTCAWFSFRLYIYLNTKTRSAWFLLLPTEHDRDSVRPALSSGLYVIAPAHTNIPHDHHYVIYWPEDSTWDDSAASSVRQNKVMFMR